MSGAGTGSLAAAIQAGLAGSAVPVPSAGVQRLIAAYRSGEIPDRPVMASRSDAAAYAAYRMPATVAATGQAIRELRRSLPGWTPATLLDFGAGTGGAAWAVAEQLPSMESMTLLEQSAEAIKLGKAILGVAEHRSLRSATWRSWRLAARGALSAPDAAPPAPGAAPPAPRAAPPATGAAPSAAGAPTGSVDSGHLPTADLATAAYVLGELTAPLQGELVALAAAAAPAVVFVEPGTPAGHRRILAARAQLLAAGYVLAAPCPHQLDCPLAVEGDWCHFGARVQRSALHRQAKGAELSFEDEKYSYVAAVRSVTAGDVIASHGRVVRRPQQRKGLVLLDLCLSDGMARRELIGKSKGDAYRRARKVAWGDRWPDGPRS